MRKTHDGLAIYGWVAFLALAICLWVLCEQGIRWQREKALAPPAAQTEPLRAPR